MFGKRLFVHPIRLVAKNVRLMCSKFDKYDMVLTNEVNNNGLLTLNRPGQMNAYNLDMIGQISNVINTWKDSKSLIMIKGTEKVFCAGGDVKAITLSNPTCGLGIARIDYTMIHTIVNLKIPYVALMNGIIFGGGVGLAVHGKYRIATERTILAIPETSIGNLQNQYFY